MTDPDKLYTLAQARKLLGRMRCADEGHKIESTTRLRNANGLIEFWGCDVCDIKVDLSYPD